jgi:hypothetical protein
VGLGLWMRGIWLIPGDWGYSGTGVAGEGVEVDLGVGGTGVVAGNGEAAAGVGEDVGAERVGCAGGGCVEERDGGLTVAGVVGGEEVDVGADDGLLAAVNASAEFDGRFRVWEKRFAGGNSR